MSDLRFFTEKDACLIMKQILSAVEYCHEKKIAHRDIKPENCVFEGKDIDSTLKVIDFGRSKILKPKNEISDKAGSLYYVAPEVLSNRNYNEKCDMWSCGVIMYLMISGFPPFNSTNRKEIIELIKKGIVDYSGILIIFLL